MNEHRFQTKSGHQQPPNIVLVTTDQQRGDCLGLEHPILQTPCVDSWARHGCYFTKGYSEHPICIPARRTLMTGAKANGHGCYTNYETWLDLPTLPEILSRANYQTQLCGKLHLWPYRKNYGFDCMDLQDGPGFGPEDNGDYLTFLRDNGVPGPFPQMAGGAFQGTQTLWNLDERLHVTNWTTEKAINFLEKRDPTRPFFLNINYFFPHEPLTPLPSYYNRYMELLSKLPEEEVQPILNSDWRGRFPKGWSTSPQQLLQFKAAYYAVINHIDDQLQRLMNVMNRLQYLDIQNTMFIFLSDHGDMIGDHECFGKSLPYEASARVPFVIRPARCMKMPRGQTIDTPVQISDIMHTILDCADIEVPADLQQEIDAVDVKDKGQSLKPLMQGDTFDREYVHGELSVTRGSLHVKSGFHYVTDGKMKYVWYPGEGVEQFFDLKQDPDELHDLAASNDCPEVIANFRSHLIDLLNGRDEGFTNGKQLLKIDGFSRNYRPDRERDTDKYREGIHFSSRDDSQWQQY